VENLAPHWDFFLFSAMHFQLFTDFCSLQSLNSYNKLSLNHCQPSPTLTLRTSSSYFKFRAHYYEQSLLHSGKRKQTKQQHYLCDIVFLSFGSWTDMSYVGAYLLLVSIVVRNFPTLAFLLSVCYSFHFVHFRKSMMSCNIRSHCFWMWNVIRFAIIHNNAQLDCGGP